MIEVRNLTRRYGERTAVDSLDFTIERGRIYGFLGPNGAGKSTTLNMITGCLAATEGTVTVDGYDIIEDAEEAKKRIGYLPELPPVYQDMTVREYLTFVAEAKSVKKGAAKSQIEKAMQLTEIEDYADRLIRHMSKGYKQRVGIAQALIGDPEVIILDEPTVGLDPKQIIGIRELIRSLGKTHTVILSSHILAEVRAVCDHVIIISHGRVVANDTPENLESVLAGENQLDIVVKTDEKTATSILLAIDSVERVAAKENDDSTIALTVTSKNGADIREAVFFAFADKRLPILHMEQKLASLEEVFLELTDSESADAPIPEEEEV
ncbi:MAG: ATP-binding cassette domain-containing protein [Oscillospiraceae bacterium]|nr:ATP-binding cassette domain-containing protein [Oscillospiraceae bacterium]